jgi:hypothetical protein
MIPDNYVSAVSFVVNVFSKKMKTLGARFPNELHNIGCLGNTPILLIKNRQLLNSILVLDAIHTHLHT